MGGVGRNPVSEAVGLLIASAFFCLLILPGLKRRFWVCEKCGNRQISEQDVLGYRGRFKAALDVPENRVTRYEIED